MLIVIGPLQLLTHRYHVVTKNAFLGLGTKCLILRQPGRFFLDDNVKSCGCLWQAELTLFYSQLLLSTIWVVDRSVFNCWHVHLLLIYCLLWISAIQIVDINNIVNKV